MLNIRDRISRYYQQLTVVLLVTLVLTAFGGIKVANADDTYLPFPYFTNFEKHEDDEDDEDDEHSRHYHHDDESNPEEDWKTKGYWKIARDHAPWVSYSGKWHLDANPKEKTIKGHGEKKKKFYAELKHYINIPLDAYYPIVKFWQVRQLNYDTDYATVQIKVKASKGEENRHKDKEWVVLKIYRPEDNLSLYQEELIPLSDYIGQSVKIRFVLHVGSNSGVPAWLVDDFLLGQDGDLDGDGVPDSLDPDRDGDGIGNDYELQVGTNPNDANDYPPDLDKDGIPDELDDDRDGDGVLNVDDVFPDDPTDWADLDGDGIGDNADPDRDGDGINNDYEILVGTDPDDPLSTPPDLDGDGIPNSLDEDRDGDGVSDVDDPFPDDPSEWSDIDADGIGDNTDPDRDGDGIDNDYETALGTDPNDPASTPPDMDLDGIPDQLDLDRDGDGVDNDLDLFPDDPTDWADLDADGVGDNADPDTDGDGIDNEYEILVGTDPYDVGSTPPDLDGDGIPDSLDSDRDGDGHENTVDAFPDDPAEWSDLDGDGIGDNADPDKDGDGIGNDYETQLGTDPNDPASTPPDLDADGIPDSLDDDRDGDSVLNVDDVFPDDATEWADHDGDGIGNNSDPDIDGDGVPNAADVFPENAAEWADLDGDGIGDNGDTDRDGDGVDNTLDAYPADATRNQLAAIQGVTTSLAETQVALSWQAYPDVDYITGYRIYRQVFGQAETQLAELPVTETTYLDTGVANATGYSYRVVAIDNNTNEGAPGNADNFFVAYNNTPASGLGVQREGAYGRLSWTALAGMRYQIYRGVTDTGLTPLQQISDTSYLDNAVLWNQGYYYQIASIADFTDVFTNTPVAVIGPPTAAFSLPALPPLGLSIEGAQLQADGAGGSVAELTVEDPERVSVSGTISEAIGPIDVTVTGGSETFSAVSSNGRFNVILPVSVIHWTVTVSEQTVADRSAALGLNLSVDNQPPVISIDGAADRSVSSDLILLSGTVTDTGSGVADLYATSSRYAGQSFAAILAGNNRFSVELPLEPGVNSLTLHAKDSRANTGSAVVNVTRAVGQAPQLQITSPANGDTLYTDKTNVTGVVYSSLPIEQIKIALGTAEQFPAQTATDGIYPFTFNGVALAEGYNTLTVRIDTPAGATEASTLVNYNPVPPTVDNTPPPVISLTAPASPYQNASSVIVAGSVSSSVEITGLTLNASPVVLTGATGGYKTFRQAVDLSSVADGELMITLVATDALAQTSQQKFTLVNDANAPVISVTSPGLLPAPAVNPVIEMPYTLTGTVSDSHLSGFSINGQDVGLLPGAAVGTYEFSVGLSLPDGLAQTVTLAARDKSGNQISQDWLFDVALPVAIEVITPKEGSELLSTAQGASIDVLARLTGLAVDDTVHVNVDSEAAQAMSMDGNVASSRIQTPQTSGEHRVTVEVRNAAGTAITRRHTGITLRDTESIAMQVERSEPANNAVSVDTNEAISVYFSRAIDPALLQLQVKETVHGRDYDLSSQTGAGLSELPEAKLVPVNRDMAPVAGSLSYYPGNRYVTFNPAQRYAYDADIYITVLYNNAELSRFHFKVKPLPTLISGRVTDQRGIPLTGVELEINELGLKGQTNDKGNFVLRAQGQQNKIRSGRYALSVNNGLKNPLFGNTEVWANIEAGERNAVATVILPLLSKDVPFVNIGSGQGTAILAQGNLSLDLSQAKLQFPNRRDSGNVHVQFTALGELPFKTTNVAIPYWLYAVQPAGIKVDGKIAMTLMMPSLYGSDSYIPADGTLVVMLGLSAQSKTIEPVGVGVINNKQVSTVTPIALQQLDFLGYAIVDEAGQAVLQRYVDGNITYPGQLISELEAIAGQ